MEKMRKWFASGLGRIGTGFIGFVSGFARQGHGSRTRLSFGSTYRRLEIAEVLVIVFLTLLVGSCLLVEVGIGLGVLVATPESQGGIDYPDGGFPSGENVYPVVGDLGEIAARLGSPNVYERRGNVIWMEEFNGGLAAWVASGLGTGNEQKIVSTNTFRAPYACQLVAGSTGSRFAHLGNYFTVLTAGRVGLEFRIWFATRWDNFRIRLYYLDGTTKHFSEIRLNDENDEILYYNSDYVLTKLADLPDLQHDHGAYHAVKLVVDFESDEYVRFFLDRTEYDMSGLGLYSGAYAENAQVQTLLYLYGRSGQNDYCQIDDVIFTQNEPG
jgi:hypothetical protein